MRVLLLANNRIGWKVVEWLADQEDEIAGLVVHPPARRKFGEEIVRASRLPPERILEGHRLREPAVREAARALRADMAVSILFGYVLEPAFLGLFPRGAVNLHPAYLPYNRGQYPNVWSIVERTPSGVTLHWIDAGVDTGDIISQVPVPVDQADTGESLYRKLEDAAVSLFRDTWPLVRAGRAPRLPQPPGGTSHRGRDVEAIDEIDLDRSYRARELIDLIRARTFPPHPGAYFRTPDGRKLYLRLEILREEELGGGGALR